MICSTETDAVSAAVLIVHSAWLLVYGANTGGDTRCYCARSMAVTFPVYVFCGSRHGYFYRRCDFTLALVEYNIPDYVYE